MPGSRLGPYEIRGVLGTGGMGRVYRAYDPGLDRDVAIKALFRELSTEETSFRRFEREAKLLATLSHPNIGSIYGFHVFDGRPYLVLELVEGENLDEILARQALAPDRAIPIARQVAEALEEAHGKGIVHRDLKPSNVKVSRSGRVKVLDFGIARRVGPRADAEKDSATLTQEGAILGTAPYMSPEQARGEAVRREDGHLGFRVPALRDAHGAAGVRGPHGVRPPGVGPARRGGLGALPPGTPAALRRLLRRCLRKDPRQRFQHVGDVRARAGGARGRAGDARRRRGRVDERRSLVWRALPWATAVLAGVAAIAAFVIRLPAVDEPSSERARSTVRAGPASRRRHAAGRLRLSGRAVAGRDHGRPARRRTAARDGSTVGASGTSTGRLCRRPRGPGSPSSPPTVAKSASSRSDS